MKVETRSLVVFEGSPLMSTIQIKGCFAEAMVNYLNRPEVLKVVEIIVGGLNMLYIWIMKVRFYDFPSTKNLNLPHILK